MIIAVACVTVTPHSMSGQETGDRLRVTLGSHWVVGEAVRVSPGQLELAVAGGGSRVFGGDGITQVERIVRKSQGKLGFAIGGAGTEPRPGCCWTCNRDRAVGRVCWCGDGSAEHGPVRFSTRSSRRG